MIEYLSDQWFEAAAGAVAGSRLESATGDPVSFSYRIHDLPADHPRAGTTVAYRIGLEPVEGSAALSEGDEPGDIRFSMTFDVAHSVATGGLSGSRAFLNGDIQVGGDVAILISRARELEQLNRLMGGDVDA